MLYNFAIGEVFRSFTTTVENPTPHAAPLLSAGLPIEPAISTTIAAAYRQRDLLRRIVELYGRDQLCGFYIFFALPVGYETISLTAHADARQAFLATLRLLHHAGKQYPVCRYASLGFEQTAKKIPVILPEEAGAIFADVKRKIVLNDDRQTSRSDWVVVFNTAGTDVRASRLNTLVKELDNLGLNT